MVVAHGIIESEFPNSSIQWDFCLFSTDVHVAQLWHFLTGNYGYLPLTDGNTRFRFFSGWFSSTSDHNLKAVLHLFTNTASGCFATKMTDCTLSKAWREYISLVIQQKCTVEDSDYGCRIWRGATFKQGVRKIAVQGPNNRPKYFRVHRLIYMIFHELSVIPTCNDEGISVEISHLCHPKLCVKPQHLVFEYHAINMDRLHCKAPFSLCRCSHGSSRCRTAGIPWCTGTHFIKNKLRSHCADVIPV